MRASVQLRVLVSVLLVCGLPFTAGHSSARGAFEGSSSDEAATQQRASLIIPAGERLVLRLEEALNTNFSSVDDRCRFSIAHEVFLGETAVVPKGATVRGTVLKVERGRKMISRPKLQLVFDELLLPDGSAVPLSVATARPISGVVYKGSDLLLQPGMLVEIQLRDKLLIPFTPDWLGTWRPSSAATPEEAGREERTDTWSGPTEGVPRALTSLGAFAGSSSTAAGSFPPDSSDYQFKVDVGLVLVDFIVTGSSGRPLENLRREDFRIFEGGVEQRFRHFSRGQLPLALALVVDRSGSVNPFMEELRQSASDVLGQLKPVDQVALFAFDSEVERLEGLTDNRQQIAGRIADISSRGNTNIYDALFDAAYYLRAAAPDRRHAIVLISDNRATSLERAGEGGVIRMALQTETVVYSIQLPAPPPWPRVPPEPVWIGDPNLVFRITEETGGEVIDIRTAGSLTSSLAQAIARLKLRYTLGYVSSNKARDGAFRPIEIRLTKRFGRPGKSYTVHARRGYYAPAEQVASQGRP
jgi:VWFA-related protein